VSPSSILAARSSDPRQLAAETILRMYLKERGEDLLVMLSELQVRCWLPAGWCHVGVSGCFWF
jgi:hypothetical protein